MERSQTNNEERSLLNLDYFTWITTLLLSAQTRKKSHSTVIKGKVCRGSWTTQCVYSTLCNLLHSRWEQSLLYWLLQEDYTQRDCLSSKTCAKWDRKCSVLNCYFDSFTEPGIIRLRLITGSHILKNIDKQPEVIKWLNMGSYQYRTG